MRRITVFRLALPCVLLGLTGFAAAQNVSIQLTPITYPIVLPDSGGTFDYLLFVTNQGSTPITATVWCMLTLPNGNSQGPVLGPVRITLNSGQTIDRRRSQTTPPRAPFGYYTFHAYVGIYPDTIWAQNQFEFQHQAVSGIEQEWVARYNGPADGNDKANSIVLGTAGNIYLTGCVSGVRTGYDYATINYNTSGEQIWVARYNGPGNDYDAGECLAVDGAGNIYVTGSSMGIGTDDDYATIKYNGAGAQQWVARYNGPGNGLEYVEYLVLGSSGDIYVTGGSAGSGTGIDWATIKYDTAGVQQWIARYNGPGNDDDYAHYIALDSVGNIFVTGASMGIGTDVDYATIKYNSTGEQQWVARYNGPGNEFDTAMSLALDSAGNVYVTGQSYGSGTSYDYATIKYDSAGGEQWVTRYNGPGNGYEGAYALALDASGNAYVTGFSEGSTYLDYATIKYNSAGVEQWVTRYDDGIAECIAMDGGGNVYVTGHSARIGSSYDYATIKYNSDGVQQWVARYNGPGNGWDWPTFLTIDSNGNAYVTGGSHGNGPDNDYATIKYSGDNMDNWLPVEATVLGGPLPQEYLLEQNYPNPFNARTALSYKLQAPSYVSLRIYDTAGRLVETLVDGWRSAGVHELTFDAGELAAGMYFAKLEAGSYVGVQKLVLIK